MKGQLQYILLEMLIKQIHLYFLFRVSCFFQFIQTFGNQTYNLYSTHSSAHHIIHLGNESGNPKAISFYHNNLTQIWNPFYSNTFTEDLLNYQIRTGQFTTNSTAASHISFSSDSLFKYSNYFLSKTLMYSITSPDKIVEAIFGSNESQIFVLTLKNINSTNFFVLIRLVNGVQISNIVSTRSLYRQKQEMYYHSRRIYLQLENTIKVYFYNDINSIFEEIYQNILSLLYDVQNVGIAISEDGSLLLIFTPDNFTILSTSSFQTVDCNYYSSFIILNAVVFYDAILTPDKQYILFSGQKSLENKIYQFDIEARTFISIQALTTFDESLGSGIVLKFQINLVSSTNQIVCSSNWKNSSNYRFKFRINNRYKCTNGIEIGGNQTCTSCLVGYILNSLYECEKHPSEAIHVQNSSYPEFINYLQSLLESNTSKLMFMNYGKFLSLTILRIVPRSFLSLACFLDDLELYQYHRKQYPESIKLFTSEVNLINEMRLAPWFFDNIENFTLNFHKIAYLYEEKNQIFISLSELDKGSDPKQIYFLTSSIEIFVQTLIRSFLFFTILKVVQLVFYFNQHRYWLLKTVYIKVRNETKWWTLITSVFQINMTNLSFNCATQLDLLGTLSVIDKLNLILTIFTLFLLIIYSISFYPLISKYSKMKQTEILLQKLDIKRKSFLYEPFLTLFRNLIRSGLMGIFMTNFQNLIISIVLIDSLSFFYTFKIRNLFKSRFCFLFSLLYYLTLSVFDIIILACQSVEMSSDNKEVMFFCILSCSAGFTSLLFLSLFLPQLKQSFYFFKTRMKIKNNKVADISPLDNFHDQNVPQTLALKKINNFVGPSSNMLDLGGDRLSNPKNNLQSSSKIEMLYKQKQCLPKQKQGQGQLQGQKSQTKSLQLNQIVFYSC